MPPLTHQKLWGGGASGVARARVSRRSGMAWHMAVLWPGPRLRTPRQRMHHGLHVTPSWGEAATRWGQGHGHAHSQRWVRCLRAQTPAAPAGIRDQYIPFEPCVGQTSCQRARPLAGVWLATPHCTHLLALRRLPSARPLQAGTHIAAYLACMEFGNESSTDALGPNACAARTMHLVAHDQRAYMFMHGEAACPEACLPCWRP